MLGASMLILSGLLFLFSCEKEVLGDADGPIRIHFTLNQSMEEVLVRCAARPLESETVVLPVDSDHAIYATLKEEAERPLRDLAAVPVNILLRIVAYQGASPVGNAVYKVTSSGGAIECVGPGLTVPAAGNYLFVAYSLGSTAAAPAYSTGAISVSPDNDLLWGSTEDHVEDGDNCVTIRLYHKFSQLVVMATGSSISGKNGITGASGLLITPGYNATLTVASGAVAKGGVAEQNRLATWEGLNTSTVTEKTPCVVYTAGEKPVVVKIASLTIGGVTYAGPTAKFDVALAPGHRYTLEVDLKKNLVWAGSNIYWDGSKLTFKAAGFSGDERRYCGVLFKWGSLVGVSPAGLELSKFTTSTPVYIPNNSGKTWSTTNSYANWDAIPYIADNVSGDRFDNYLMDNNRNISTYWNARKGDICRYLSLNSCGPGDGLYRMPTSYEWGSRDEYKTVSDGWTMEGTWDFLYSTVGPDGRRVMAGWATSAKGNVAFPATGQRSEGGALSHVGACGLYWSGSASGSTMGRSVDINDSKIYMNRECARVRALAVRCVRNEGGS